MGPVAFTLTFLSFANRNLHWALAAHLEHLVDVGKEKILGILVRLFLGLLLLARRLLFARIKVVFYLLQLLSSLLKLADEFLLSLIVFSLNLFCVFGGIFTLVITFVRVEPFIIKIVLDIDPFLVVRWSPFLLSWLVHEVSL